MLLIELRPTRLKSRRRRSAVSPMNMTLLRNGAKSRSFGTNQSDLGVPEQNTRPATAADVGLSPIGERALARSLWLRDTGISTAGFDDEGVK